MPLTTPRILLLGANGQVGFEAQRALAPLGDVMPATRSGTLPGGAPCEALPLDDVAALPQALDRLRPDVIVNAAAYTAVDRAEDDAVAAMRINADAPAALAQWCARHDALLVHYSTDYVFDGAADRPLREDDAVAPLGAYGRSKLAGEQAVAAAGAAHLVLRTAWVYAARGQNFMRTMLRLGADRDALRVVADQRGAPTPARWIAAATAAMLASARWRQADARGTFHLTAGGATTWHGFAEAIFDDALAAGVLKRAPRVDAIATHEYPTRAARPAYSVLDGARLAAAYGIALPDWRRGVAEVVAELAP